MKSSTKHKVFLITAASNAKEAKKGTGDTDYVFSLAEGIQALVPVKLITTARSSDLLLDEINKSKAESAIIHLLINPGSPFNDTGCLIKPEELQRFKNAGMKVVITAFEFAKYENDNIDSKGEARKKTLDYLFAADSIIFLDEGDKQSAIGYASQTKHSLAGQTKLLESQVIHVPPTVPTSKTPLKDRGKNIISFGMIAQGKGIAHIIKLARLMRESKAPEIKNKKILVVGSVRFSQDDLLNQPFQDLLLDMYPGQEEKIRNIKQTEELVSYYNKTLKSLPSRGPIELHLNVPENELNDLFNRCTYSFLPAYRGATLRNTSFSSSLANRFITYSSKTKVTPKCLLPEDKDSEIVKFVPFEYDKCADSVLEDIIMREREPSLNEAMESRIVQFVQEQISPEIIAFQHQTIYRNLTTSLEVEIKSKDNDEDKDKEETKALPIASKDKSELRQATSVTPDIVDKELKAKVMPPSGTPSPYCHPGLLDEKGQPVSGIPEVIAWMDKICQAASDKYRTVVTSSWTKTNERVDALDLRLKKVPAAEAINAFNAFMDRIIVIASFLKFGKVPDFRENHWFSGDASRYDNNSLRMIYAKTFGLSEQDLRTASIAQIAEQLKRRCVHGMLTQVDVASSKNLEAKSKAMASNYPALVDFCCDKKLTGEQREHYMSRQIRKSVLAQQTVAHAYANSSSLFVGSASSATASSSSSEQKPASASEEAQLQFLLDVFDTAYHQAKPKTTQNPYIDRLAKDLQKIACSQDPVSTKVKQVGDQLVSLVGTRSSFCNGFFGFELARGDACSDLVLQLKIQVDDFVGRSFAEKLQTGLRLCNPLQATHLTT